MVTVLSEVVYGPVFAVSGVEPRPLHDEQRQEVWLLRGRWSW